MFGEFIDKDLKDILPIVKSGVALDLGCAAGANSVFLAQNNFKVVSIDTDKNALDVLEKNNQEKNLDIEIINSDIKDYNFPKNNFDLILALNILNFFDNEQLDKIFTSIKNYLKTNGILFLKVFSIKDPSYEIMSRRCKLVGINTFYSEKIKKPTHFFTEEELRGILKDFKIIKFEHRIFEDEHGDQGKHIHATFEVIAGKIN